jgi:hypothetical protein
VSQKVFSDYFRPLIGRRKLETSVPIKMIARMRAVEMVLVAGFAPALATFSTSCLLLVGLREPMMTSTKTGMPWTRTTRSLRGAHCLANKPGPLGRLTFHMVRRTETPRAKIGPRGRTCTCNFSVLSGTPLHWATRGCLRTATGTHGRICTGTVRVLSAPSLPWTTWAKLVPREGFEPSTFPF